MSDHNERAKKAFSSIMSFNQFSAKNEPTEQEKREKKEKEDIDRRNKAFSGLIKQISEERRIARYRV